MANFNKVILVGRLTRDPETRTFSNGGMVAKFGFAVTNRKKNSQTGQWEDEPMFIDCEAYNRGDTGKQADLVRDRLRKGSQVLIEGKLHLDTWQDKQTGQNRTKHKLVVDNFQFLDPRQDGGMGRGDGMGGDEADMGGSPRQVSRPPAGRSAPAKGGYTPPADDGPADENNGERGTSSGADDMAKATKTKADKKAEAKKAPEKKLPQKKVKKRQQVLKGSHGGMQLVLIEDVAHLGKQGDLVEVKPGYGRNYLLPQGLALVPDAHNLKRLDAYKIKVQKAKEARVADLKVLAEQLSRLAAVTIEANATEEGHLYGSIGPIEISKALKGKNLQVEPDMVRMEHPIKEANILSEIPLALGYGIEAKIQVLVVGLQQAPGAKK